MNRLHGLSQQITHAKHPDFPAILQIALQLNTVGHNDFFEGRFFNPVHCRPGKNRMTASGIHLCCALNLQGLDGLHQSACRIDQIVDYQARSPADFTDKIYNFLGVPPFPQLKNREENIINYARRMTQSEREYLFSIFENDIAKLENLLGWDCSDWKP